ncbi:hypothetical protein D1872_289380 [compost metagenome]
MHDTVDCPYCGHENDMSDALTDGLSSDNTFDHECSNCEKEFEVYVEFDPSFSASKIEYTNCDNCGDKTRDIREKGRIFPFPKALEGKRVCKSCFYKALTAEYSNK